MQETLRFSARFCISHRAVNHWGVKVNDTPRSDHSENCQMVMDGIQFQCRPKNRVLHHFGVNAISAI